MNNGTVSHLRLKNFQCHDARSVDLGLITVFVGPSDTGKSSILRALRFLSQNKPTGSGFVSHGEKECRVGAVVDARRIERRYGSENLYKLGQQEYRAFGRDVPDPVKDLLRVSDANFQGQHDSAFWLALSPGEVARQINSVVDLAVIDRALTAAASRVRNCKSKLATCKERRDEAQQEVAGLEWVVKADLEYKEVETAEAAVEKVSERTRDLTAVIDKAVRMQEKVGRLERRAQGLQDVAVAARDAERGESRVGRLKRLTESVGHHQRILDRGAPDFGAVQEAFEKFDALDKRVGQLEALVREANRVHTKAEDKTQEWHRVRDELEAVDVVVCPTCGRPMEEVGQDER